MSGRYLTDLADVVRGTGLVVQEEPGWTSRARSSGGYASGRPTTVMVHHTASNPGSDGQADVDYCCYGSSDRPLANLYLSRTGKVWVMAAGATNTNGKGGPLDGVPADSMNTYAIGIEAANAGTGEPWPTVQQDAYLVLVRALQQHYALPYCRAHFEWAPTRKIDPAGNSRYATGGASWDMNRFRVDVAAGPTPIPPEPTPPPLEEDDDMADFIATVLFDSGKVNYFLVTSRGYRAVSSDVMNDMGRADPAPTDGVMPWYSWRQASWDSYVATRGLKAV